MRKFSFLVLTVSFFIVFMVNLYAEFEKKAIADGVLRLHVVAESNSKRDQELKLKVRDAVLDSAKELFSDVKNKDEAIAVAKENARNNGVNVTFKKSDLFSNISKLGKFDIIVSNPPYIPSADIEQLEEEVKNYDPLLALDGGVTGLDFYTKIIECAPTYLTNNGKIFFEIGINQAKDVKKLLQKNFKDIRIVKDYNKIDRVVVATCNK